MLAFTYFSASSAVADQLEEEMTRKVELAARTGDKLDAYVALAAFKEWFDYRSYGTTEEYSAILLLAVIYGDLLPNWND